MISIILFMHILEYTYSRSIGGKLSNCVLSWSFSEFFFSLEWLSILWTITSTLSGTMMYKIMHCLK